MPRLSKIGAACLAAFGFGSGGIVPITATYLTVAGGGGGGSLRGGGGGAGGLLTNTLTLNPTLSYTVIVGAGGVGAISGAGIANYGTSGSASSIAALVSATGGGGGASGGAGLSGGSGGGGTWNNNAGGSGVSGQGFAGGAGSTGANYGSGGGGGSSAVGSAGTTSAGGNGGAGTASSITGTSVTYAGGGGGGINNGNTGGSGGSGGGSAGISGNANASPATANLGGGGGGGGYDGGSNTNGAGGNGGSGVVIVKYTGVQQFGGGIVSYDGTNTIHTFNTSGQLVPLNSLTASYLIVAGGGGGGGASSSGGGGGGGAGGLLSGSGLTLDTNSTYLITVGAGGTAGAPTATAGGSSAISMVSTTVVGGGNGGAGFNAGANGGSGGGGGANRAAGTGTSLQGNNGGAGDATASGGGGGGAGAVGTAGSGTGTQGGAGGIGVASSISGTSTYYAGGGGGGSQGAGGAGGNGGGGSGTTTTGGSATANRGGGGAGGSYSSATNYNGGNGGSGVVAISYAGSTQLMAGGTVTIVGGYVIHTFTSSGYLTPLTFIGNSLRFRASASATLTRTPTVASNRTTWTMSMWVKRGQLGTGADALFMFTAGTSSTDRTYLLFDNGAGADTMQLAGVSGGSTAFNIITTQVFRDTAAWYHLVFAVDTTQATASNRIKVYVNGNQVTALSASTYPSQNFATTVDNNTLHTFGSRGYTGAGYFDGYMADVRLIDGQQLTANSFGTYNSFGVWQPINYGGSYGTNGFYLPFTPNSTSSYTGSFNGSSQYLSVATSNALQFGSSDYTAEAWILRTSQAKAEWVLGGGGAIFQWGLLTNGTMQVSLAGGTTLTASTGTVPLNVWTHIAVVKASGTLTYYINGVSAGAVSDGNNYSTGSLTVNIGTTNSSTGNAISGYLSNVRVVKGTAVYTSRFTPSTSPLTAITNTSLLTLQNATIIDNSTNAATITNTGTVTTSVLYPFTINIASDFSPQSNHWTTNNISLAPGVTYDSMTDVPTLTSATASNYAVLNPLSNGGNWTLTDGNLKATNGTGGSSVYSTIYVTSGKYYVEYTVTNRAGDFFVGLFNSTAASVFTAYRYTGERYNGSAWVTYGATYTTGDVISMAFDVTAGTVEYYKNGTSQGSVSITYPSAFVAPTVYSGTSGTVTTANFGQQPFAYTPPTNFVALNTYNM